MILFYQHVVKPDIYPLINKPTTPVSDDALEAGMAGSYWYGKSAADAIKWCSECGK
jgi:hypothetical protein